MLDRHADLADFAAREDVVGIIGRLRGQIEGDGEARLALAQIHPVQLIRLFRRSSGRHRCGRSTAGRDCAEMKSELSAMGHAPPNAEIYVAAQHALRKPD
jgi:hypothetical protein